MLLAKIQALLRRTYDFGGQTALLEHRDAILNTADAVLTYHGERIDLTKNEYRILQALLEQKGKGRQSGNLNGTALGNGQFCGREHPDCQREPAAEKAGQGRAARLYPYQSGHGVSGGIGGRHENFPGIISAGIWAVSGYFWHAAAFLCWYFLCTTCRRKPCCTAVCCRRCCICSGFSMHFRKYYQKCRTLRQMQQEIVITTQYLPSPEDVSEQAYQELVELLYQKQQELTQEWQVRYSDMMEYYTAWTHQMKTPIAAMRLHLQAADTPENHILLEDLQRIEQYVEMVLCYLRLDSDSTDYLFVRCDLDSVVRQAVRRFSSQFIHRKIRLEYEPLGCRVLTDEKWLLFVLEQVLSNALKYTRTGGIEIWLEDERGNRVSENPNLKQNTAPGICNTAPATLVIADSGIGIQPEDLPRIFAKRLHRRQWTGGQPCYRDRSVFKPEDPEKTGSRDHCGFPGG